MGKASKNDVAAVAAFTLALPACSLTALEHVEPAPIGAARLPDGAVSPWLVAQYGEDVRYRMGEADLDGDGLNDALVYIGGPGQCGSGGCDLAVLRRTSDGFEQIGSLSVTRLPVGVLDSRTNGLRDIVVTVGGGGIPTGLRRLRFDGESYPANPTVAPAEPVDDIGTVVIRDGDLFPIVR